MVMVSNKCKIYEHTVVFYYYNFYLLKTIIYLNWHLYLCVLFCEQIVLNLQDAFMLNKWQTDVTISGVINFQYFAALILFEVL